MFGRFPEKRRSFPRCARCREEDDIADRTVMLILLDREQPWPRTLSELERELGETAAESVARLRRAGLL